MPDFKIRTLDHAFATESALQDHQHAKDALSTGVRGALMMAIDEIAAGKTVASIEVIIEDADGQPLHKSVVVVSVWTMAVGSINDG